MRLGDGEQLDLARGAAGGATGGVALGLKDFWQRAPTGLEVRNEGDGYAQLADVAIGDPQRPRILRPGLVGYVLPGQVMHWNLDTASLPEAATFSAKINGEPAQTALPATPPAR